MSVITDIETNGFIATQQQIEQLVWEHVIAVDFSKRSKNTFMSILIATAQHEGGTLEILEEVYSRLYEWVKNGVKKAGFDESKTGFARSAMATVRGFVRRGNDLMEIDPATVTKRDLQPPVIAAPKLQRTENRLILSLRALAKTDEDAALEEVESLMAQLKALRKEWRPRVVSHQLERQQPTAH